MSDIYEDIIELMDMHIQVEGKEATHIEISTDNYIRAKAHKSAPQYFDRPQSAIPSQLCGLWIHRVDGVGILKVYTK